MILFLTNWCKRSTAKLSEMKILLDAYTFPWLITDDEALSASARSVFIDGDSAAPMVKKVLTDRGEVQRRTVPTTLPAGR